MTARRLGSVAAGNDPSHGPRWYPCQRPGCDQERLGLAAITRHEADDSYPRHQCRRLPATASRPAGSLASVTAQAGLHRRPDGQRCLCHGHCGDCGEPAVMDRLGRYVHASEYRPR